MVRTKEIKTLEDAIQFVTKEELFQRYKRTIEHSPNKNNNVKLQTNQSNPNQNSFNKFNQFNHSRQNQINNQQRQLNQILPRSNNTHQCKDNMCIDKCLEIPNILLTKTITKIIIIQIILSLLQCQAFPLSNRTNSILMNQIYNRYINITLLLDQNSERKTD